jgi:hypothetical protein
VHRVDLKMTRDQTRLEQFLNSLEGDVVAIIPNVTWSPSATHVDFVLVVERLASATTSSLDITNAARSRARVLAERA